MQATYKKISVISGLIMTLASPLALATPPAAQAPGEGSAVAPATPPKVVMLRMGKDEITVQDYVTYLQANQGLIKSSATPAGKARTLKSIVSDMLIKREIFRKGLVPKAQEEDHQAMLKGYRELASMYFPRPAPPPEGETRAFYELHRADYGIPAMRRISQIEFKIQKGGGDAKKAEARQKAEGALRRLEAGEAFDKVAGEVTENKDARARNGDLGFLPQPWLRDEVRNLKVGQRTGVIETPAAFEIMMPTDDRAALISPFEEVKARVEQRIIDEGQDRLKDAYLAELTQQTPIVIVQEELKPLFPEGLFPKKAK